MRHGCISPGLSGRSLRYQSCASDIDVSQAARLRRKTGKRKTAHCTKMTRGSLRREKRYDRRDTVGLRPHSAPPRNSAIESTMIDLSSLEVWFVTGSQHLYGPKTLKQVEADSRQIVDGLNAAARLPVKLVFKPVVTTPDEITAMLRDAERVAELHRPRRLDAHVQPVQDVDRGPDQAHQAALPPAHPVQSRHPVVVDRHGLHEPQPVRPRRPRVRVHLLAPAHQPQGRRRPLAGEATCTRGSTPGCAPPPPGTTRSG